LMPRIASAAGRSPAGMPDERRGATGLRGEEGARVPARHARGGSDAARSSRQLRRSPSPVGRRHRGIDIFAAALDGGGGGHGGDASPPSAEGGLAGRSALAPTPPATPSVGDEWRSYFLTGTCRAGRAGSKTGPTGAGRKRSSVTSGNSGNARRPADAT
jgi:hypothetical protein